MTSQPTTTSASTPKVDSSSYVLRPIFGKDPNNNKLYYMNPKIVRERVGLVVKPTNPLLQYIPELKNIDEFNEFTKTEQYSKLMDFRNPIIEPKMDPSLRKEYDRVQNTRQRFMEIKDYPLYAKLPFQRLWYRGTWALTILAAGYAFSNVFFVIKNT